MLTKINELADTAVDKDLVIVFATNFLDRMDPAIVRPGRIDAKYAVLPPNNRERERAIRDGATRDIGGSDPLEESIAASRSFSYPEINFAVKRAALKQRAESSGSFDLALVQTLKAMTPQLRLDWLYENRCRQPENAAVPRIPDRAIELAKREAALVSTVLYEGGAPSPIVRPPWTTLRARAANLAWLTDAITETAGDPDGDVSGAVVKVARELRPDSSTDVEQPADS
jgi:hypothetical protein